MIDSPTIHTTGLVLLHFIWQGALIGVLFMAGRLAMTGASAVGRYNWAVLCLVLLALAPVLTFAWMWSGPGTDAATGLTMVAQTLQTGASGAVPAPDEWIPSSLLPVIVGLWLCGVALMSARLGTGWWYVHQLRRNAVFHVGPEIQLQLERLATELSLARRVSLALSDRIAGPMLVGVIKPLILLPVGLASRLSTREIETILAHELAHLRRADHIVNLFQNIVETLLFYHPVVRWVSNVIRAEREMASDEQAARLIGDRITYAETLLKLERSRSRGPQLAIGMADHQVLTRVRHLLAPKPRQPGSIISGTAAVTVVLISVAAALASTGLNALSENERVDRRETSPAVEASTVTAPTEPGDEQPQSGPRETDTAAVLPSTATEVPATVTEPEPRGDDLVNKQQDDLESTNNDGPERAQPAAVADLGASSGTVSEPDPGSAPPPAVEPETEWEPQLLETPQLAMAALTESAVLEETSSANSRAATRNPPPEPRILGGTVRQQFVPEYPTGARRQGREGHAEVRLTVNRDGRVVDAVVVEESPRGYGFGQAAVQAAEQWRFEPFTRQGEAIAHVISTGFDFVDPPPCERVTGSRIARC